MNKNILKATRCGKRPFFKAFAQEVDTLGDTLEATTKKKAKDTKLYATMEKNPNPQPLINKTPFNVQQQEEGTVSHVRADGDGIVDPSRNSGVIYFENFPRTWRYHDLEKVFARYGALGRVSLASKRTKCNVSFCFFRPESNKDMSWIVDQLNLVAIGRFRLRAFRAKFSEKKLILAPILKKEAVVVCTVSFPSFRDRRSNREVASVVQCCGIII